MGKSTFGTLSPVPIADGSYDQHIGGCQMFLLMGGYLSPKRTKKLSISQRLVGFTNGVQCLVGPILGTIHLVAIPLGLLFGTPFAYYQGTNQLRWLLRA